MTHDAHTIALNTLSAFWLNTAQLVKQWLALLQLCIALSTCQVPISPFSCWHLSLLQQQTQNWFHKCFPPDQTVDVSLRMLYRLADHWLYFLVLFVQFLRDIGDKPFHLLQSMLPFRGLYVCLSRSWIVHKWQKISIWLLLHTTSLMSLRMLKFGLHWSTPSSHNFSQKWPTPCLFERGDIRWQITMEGQMLEIVQWSQWRAYRKPPLLFQMVPSLTPYDFPCPKLGVPDAPFKTNFVKRAASSGLST